jgi:hypothetical protein
MGRKSQGWPGSVQDGPDLQVASSGRPDSSWRPHLTKFPARAIRVHLRIRMRRSEAFRIPYPLPASRAVSLPFAGFLRDDAIRVCVTPFT